MSELTRRNFILDERVVGKVTLMTPTRISPEEAYQVFQSALEIKGFTAIEDGKVIRIIPSAQARQSGLKVYQDGRFGGEGYVTQLIRMTYVNPQEITRALTPLMSKDGSLIAYAPTNSLIITDAVPNIRKIESLVRAMDVAATEGKGKINVYYLKHANSEDIAKGMAALVSRLPVPPAGGAAAGPSSILEGAVTITSDKATNSLIIVASPGDYETVKDVILKLDIRRRQVYVEAAIIEMSLQKQRELGFEFLYAPQQIQSGAGAPTTPLGGTNFGNIGALVANGPAGLGNLSGLSVAAIKGTFRYNGTDYLNVGALLRALQTDSDVNVLSTPNILTTDNQKAEIMVGQNVPFTVGQTQNATTGTQGIFNTIERKDVGIKLSITPQISSDDNVRLDINQEISDVVAASALNSAGLILNKRSATTTVVVKDRETMVIGGLIRDNVTSSESKVPFLGDIPILGWLFKYKSSRVEKTNLMIFITPYIIKNAQDAEDITDRKSDVLENFRKEYHIEKKGVEPFSIKKSSDRSTGPAPSTPSAATSGTDAMQSSPTVTAPAADAVQSAPTVTAPAADAVQSAPTATTPIPEQSTVPAKDQR
jgi:general secretion pathway protein D